MDLKDFTKQALIQIVEGAKEADVTLKKNNAQLYTYNNINKVFPATNIDFDVAITTTETEGSNGMAGLKVASLVNLGGGIENKFENQIVSRVKYTIPIILGPQKDK